MDLKQDWPKPSAPRPIVVFGAGSIVRDAHLPAWRAGGYEVAGLHDPDHTKAEALADTFGTRALSLQAALAVQDASLAAEACELVGNAASESGGGFFARGSLSFTLCLHDMPLVVARLFWGSLLSFLHATFSTTLVKFAGGYVAGPWVVGVSGAATFSALFCVIH